MRRRSIGEPSLLRGKNSSAFAGLFFFAAVKIFAFRPLQFSAVYDIIKYICAAAAAADTERKQKKSQQRKRMII